VRFRLQPVRECQHVGDWRALRAHAAVLQRVSGRSYDVSVGPFRLVVENCARATMRYAFILALLPACADVVSPYADAGVDSTSGDVGADNGRYTPDADGLRCASTLCPSGYICVQRCENGVCGENSALCRRLPIGCPEPAMCTNTAFPAQCDCPACLQSLCPAACTYYWRSRNIVDCNH
jgi:hypothetical protein